MALTPSEALNLIFDARVTDARVRYARTLSNLINMGKIRSISKTTIDWDVRFSGTTSKREAVTADVTPDTGSNTAPANLRIGRYRHSHTFDISTVAIAEAAVRAPGELKNLFAETIDDALSVLFRDINDAIWLGDGTAASNEVVGMMRILDNTLPYANINPATWDEWKAIINTNGTPRPFSRSIMLSMDEQMDRLEEDYDVVFMNPSMITSYKALFDTLGGAAALPNSRAEMTLPNADLGHGNAYYNGRTIVSEPKCPVGTIVLLDSSELDLFIFDTPTENDVNPSKGGEVINTAYGLPFRIKQMNSNNPDSMRFNIRAMAQLRLRNRKAIKGILQLQ